MGREREEKTALVKTKQELQKENYNQAEKIAKLEQEVNPYKRSCGFKLVSCFSIETIEWVEILV